MHILFMDIDKLPFRFKKGYRATFFEDYAVIGDVHLGFEEEMNSRGYNVWEKTDEILRSILSLKVKKLIMLGDLRANYIAIRPKEGGHLIKFFSKLSDSFDEIIITKGNHDGGLEKIVSRFNNIQLISEFIHKNVGFMHGHALPSMKLIKEADILCISHLHPFVLIRDSNGVYYRKDCFFFLRISLPKKTYPASKISDCIIVPKFNPYIGGSEEFEPKGILKYAKIESKMTTDLEIF